MTAKAKKRELPWSMIGISFCGLFFITITLLGDQGLLKLIHLHQLKNQLLLENSLLQNQNAVLMGEAKLLRQSDYLREILRSELGYIEEDEVLYHIPDASR